ncbi:siphovirus Gp157 family protein [Synechococcus sp. CS-1328]|uniref:siphovirus Gp157 family protein n=1 Tax=Synechococcus sp. CS-1328 TaxID=2847976 RepID=UPI00223B7991|nr:siphovirus Gp157 family protein [Synechococcus sp. CS-1328]MCT0225606.1 siphovirus Gp157 family protein [Synechococcus sp. CS-1328]
MSVSVAVAAPAPAANSPAAAPLPTLWELGHELQAETHWIARLSERLDTEDDSERAQAITDLEETLAAEEGKREVFTRKADATCWVIERLRAESSYHQSQAKRYAALAKGEDARADALESTLVHLLTRLDPTATSHKLVDHRLSSRTSDAVEIDDPEALPSELVALHTSRTPDKVSIKARIRAAIASAITGLPKPEAAQVAFSIAATAVPGARLIQRRHWSIR